MDVHRTVKPTTTPNKVVKKATNAAQPTKKPKRVEEKRGNAYDVKLQISNQVQLQNVPKSSMVNMNKWTGKKMKHRTVSFDSDVNIMEVAMDADNAAKGTYGQNEPEIQPMQDGSFIIGLELQKDDLKNMEQTKGLVSSTMPKWKSLRMT